MMINSENILGGSMLAVGSLALYMSRGFPFGAAILPRAVSVILMLLGSILLIQSLKARSSSSKSKKGKDVPAVIGCIIVTGGYVWLWPILGFIADSILMILVMSIMLGGKERLIRNCGMALIFAVPIVVVMYFIFDRLLLVPLPQISIF